MRLVIRGQTYEDLSAAQAAINEIQDREKDLQSTIGELEDEISQFCANATIEYCLRCVSIKVRHCNNMR